MNFKWATYKFCMQYSIRFEIYILLNCQAKFGVSLSRSFITACLAIAWFSFVIHFIINFFLSACSQFSNSIKHKSLSLPRSAQIQSALNHRTANETVSFWTLHSSMNANVSSDFLSMDFFILRFIVLTLIEPIPYPINKQFKIQFLYSCVHLYV